MKSKSKMKKQNVYCEYFKNVNLPYNSLQMLVSKAQPAERVEVLTYIDKNDEEELPERTGKISINIYSAPPSEFKGKLFPRGYLLEDDWNLRVWFCESYKHVSRIIENYKVYIKKKLAEEFPYLKIMKIN